MQANQNAFLKRIICAIFLLSFSCFGQNTFPNKAVNLIVPFPPGGAADQPSRLISQALFNVWQQPAVVLTKPGAGGAIGAGLEIGCVIDCATGV